MKKLAQAQTLIADALAKTNIPAIALSFGKDSMLVAALVLQQVPETTCIWLHQCLTKSQRRCAEQVMVAWNLTVWGCGVQAWQLLPHEGQVYAGLTYALNGDTFTTIHDVLHDSAAPCLFHLQPQTSPALTLPVETIFTGWRAQDTHPLMDASYEPVTLGNISLVNPLADWTEEEIWEVTAALSLPVNTEKYQGNPFADPDNLIANTDCFVHGECRCQR